MQCKANTLLLISVIRRKGGESICEEPNPSVQKKLPHSSHSLLLSKGAEILIRVKIMNGKIVNGKIKVP